MSPELLSKCTGANIERARIYAPTLTFAMDSYGITSTRQRAMFLANVGHETGRLVWLQELWGPTPAQKGYEGRADLGNSRQGDGFLFRGRGMFQTTGRANYVRLRDRLRYKFPGKQIPDFEYVPTLVSQSEFASLAAADFWDEHKLNTLAETGDVQRVRKVINGGTNGLAEVSALYLAGLDAVGGK